MQDENIRSYEELNEDELDVLGTFRMMKLQSDYFKFKFYDSKLEDILNDYEHLKQTREKIQEKFFALHEELNEEGMIDGDIPVSDWGFLREQEKESWDNEINFLSEIKSSLEIAIELIESGDAEKAIIEMEKQ